MLYKTTLFCTFTAFIMTSQPEIIIQPDYWKGDKCLENGVPWQVPDSIYKEAEFCQENDIALEFGSGGSTVFLAQRCKFVISIETDGAWASCVRNRLQELNLKNVMLMHIPREDSIVSFVQTLNTENIGILSVDTVHGYNRSLFLNTFLEKGISPNLHMIILDNYSAPELFPTHFNIEIMNFPQWETHTYDDHFWCGSGTRLHIRKALRE